MPIKSTPSLFMASISFSEIECKIIDYAGCFENTPEKKVEKGACTLWGQASKTSKTLLVI